MMEAPSGVIAFVFVNPAFASASSSCLASIEQPATSVSAQRAAKLPLEQSFMCKISGRSLRFKLAPVGRAELHVLGRARERRYADPENWVELRKRRPHK